MGGAFGTLSEFTQPPGRPPARLPRKAANRRKAATVGSLEMLAQVASAFGLIFPHDARLPRLPTAVLLRCPLFLRSDAGIVNLCKIIRIIEDGRFLRTGQDSSADLVTKLVVWASNADLAG